MTKARDLANFVSTGNPLADGTLSVADISDLTATAAELNVLDGITATTAELNILDGVTATANELNVLDGITSSTAELNILDGVTSSTAELNLLDGAVANTVVNSTAVIYGASGEITANQIDILAQGDLRLQDTTGGQYVALQAPGTVSSSFTLTLPAADGTNGQVLQTNGSGALSFATITSGSLVYISQITANNSATADFTGIGSTYKTYLVTFSSVLPATDNVTFRMRTSTDNGSNYDSGISDYSVMNLGGAASNESFYDIAFSVGNASGEGGVFGHLYLFNPSNSTVWTTFQSTATNVNNSNAITMASRSGARKANADVDAIRFYFSSGNITSGTVTLYGIKDS